MSLSGTGLSIYRATQVYSGAFLCIDRHVVTAGSRADPIHISLPRTSSTAAPPSLHTLSVKIVTGLVYPEERHYFHYGREHYQTQPGSLRHTTPHIMPAR